MATRCVVALIGGAFTWPLSSKLSVDCHWSMTTTSRPSSSETFSLAALSATTVALVRILPLPAFTLSASKYFALSSATVCCVFWLSGTTASLG